MFFLSAGRPTRTYRVQIISVDEQTVAMLCAEPYKELLEASADVYGIVSADGDPIYQSPSSYMLWGYEPGDERASDVDAVFDEESLAVIDRVLRDHSCSAARNSITRELRTVAPQARDGNEQIAGFDLSRVVPDPTKANRRVSLHPPHEALGNER